MAVWKGAAFAVALTSSATFVLGGLAAAITTGERLQLAQADEATEEEAGATEDDSAAAAETEAGTDEPAAEEAAAADEGPAEFSEEFLADPAHQEVGEVVWETCGGCHGARAYPGKGPQLRPNRYTPDFVFDRVTNGYRKMPPWKDVFTKEERMAVVAYILGDDFSP